MTTENTQNNPFVNSDYQAQQERKKASLQDKASSASQQSNNLYKQARNMAGVIPFGQPILVGHHSEKRDRKYREKIENTFIKSHQAADKAQHYEQKAARVGTGGIASNDPEAITKLQKKLDNLTAAQNTMKLVNKIARSKKLSDQEKINKITDEGLLKEDQAKEILKPDFAGRTGFADYVLQNNNSDIRRTKKRIEELTKLQESTPIKYENDDFSLYVENGRIVVDFKGGKPNDSTRQAVKSYAFKWSRHTQTWVRKATSNAIYAAERLLQDLKNMENIY